MANLTVLWRPLAIHGRVFVEADGVWAVSCMSCGKGGGYFIEGFGVKESGSQRGQAATWDGRMGFP